MSASLPRPLRAEPSSREIHLLRWLAQGARLHPPARPESTIHPVTLAGVRLAGIQGRLVKRLVATHRLVWDDQQQAYTITDIGREVLATIPIRRGW